MNESLILDAARDSLRQLLVVGGPCALMAVALRFTERGLMGRLLSRLGFGGVYLTGWLGVPVHELSHAVVCLPFGHRITQMRLFAPNRETGTLGAVEHSFNPRNPWAQIGRFFIGIAPLIGGSLALWVLARALGPAQDTVPTLTAGLADPLEATRAALDAAVAYGTSLGEALLDGTTWREHGWATGIYLYLSLCVGAHLSPSRTDLRGGLAGLITLLVALVALNAAARGMELSTADAEQAAAALTSQLLALLALALVLSTAALLLVTAVTALLPRRG